MGATVTAYCHWRDGYGSAARVLGSTTTTSGGKFSLTAYQTCEPTDFVYLVATGGNPGVAGTQNNSALALMTGLGTCQRQPGGEHRRGLDGGRPYGRWRRS